MKKNRIHNFYLTETDTDEATGYRVKQLNGKGEIVKESFIPSEGLEWFKDKDYQIVSRENYKKIGVEIDE